MSDAKLRELLDEVPVRQAQAWVRRQQAVARQLLGRLAILTRDPSVPSEISDLTVVAEAIANIKQHNPVFVWDGQGDFDKFFFECMKKALNKIRNEYRRSKYISPLSCDHPLALGAVYTPPLIEPKRAKLEEEAVPKLVARAVANNRLRSKSKTTMYLALLPRLADEQATQQEVRRQLVVGHATYRQIHRRITRLVEDYGGEDK